MRKQGIEMEKEEYSISIVPFFIAGLSCFMNAIMTVVVWKRNEYKRCFANSWGFKYKGKDRVLGKQISAEIDRVTANLIQYYGIDFQFQAEVLGGEPKEKWIKVIKKEIKIGKPVVVFCDTYYLEWQNGYRKQHGEHACLIIGFNKNGFICIDSMPICENGFISYKDFMLGSRNFVEFDFLEYDRLKFDYKALFKNALAKLNYPSEKSSFSQMRDFSKDFLLINMTEELKGASTKWAVPLHKNVEKIYGGRVQFLEMLELLKDYDTDIDLELLIDKFNTLTVKWSMIRTFIFRLAENQTINLVKKISRKISETADFEEEIAQLIYDMIYLKRIDVREDKINKSSCLNIQFVKLDPYYNEYSHYFSIQDDYVLEQEILSDCVWSVANMRFYFPKVELGRANSIACKFGDTRININEAYYNCLQFLIYGTWENTVEEIQVVYKGRQKQLLEIGFTDWSQAPCFGEKIAWEGYYKSKTNERDVIHARIYGISYEVDASYPICQIILPKSKNAHFFAISGACVEGEGLNE